MNEKQMMTQIQHALPSFEIEGNAGMFVVLRKEYVSKKTNRPVAVELHWEGAMVYEQQGVFADLNGLKSTDCEENPLTKVIMLYDENNEITQEANELFEKEQLEEMVRATQYLSDLTVNQ